MIVSLTSPCSVQREEAFIGIYCFVLVIKEQIMKRYYFITYPPDISSLSFLTF
ncbi:MAG: hypothetical protein GY943_04570 [Chloroflexi bacterium]|nr:hypothetical protein [Chloroflexota bacterium]